METPPTRTSCFRCGRVRHSPEKCYFRTKKCRKCLRTGHIAKISRVPREADTATEKVDTKYVEQDNTQTLSNESELGLFTVKAVQGQSDDGIYVDLRVNGVSLRMELDTGAALTLVSEVWRNWLGAIPLKNTEAKLRTNTG